MARRQNRGDGQLEESLRAMQQAQTQMLQALANMAQTQTASLARMAETDAEIADLRHRSNQLDAEVAGTNRLNAERFARIEALLAEHSRVLAELPKAVHREFGFQPPQPPTD